MIDYQQARQIAADWLSAHPARGRDGVLEFCILDEHAIEVEFGWVFSYMLSLGMPLDGMKTGGKAPRRVAHLIQ
jgi:hypothetical protein